MSEPQMPDVQATLEEFFGKIIRSGVTVTFDEWSKLPKEGKAALLAANRAYRAETVAMLATALSGKEGLAWVMKEADGGDAFLDLKLDEAVERHMQKVGAK
jgi:hypothetical protein